MCDANGEGSLGHDYINRLVSVTVVHAYHESTRIIDLKNINEKKKNLNTLTTTPTRHM